MLSRLLFDTPQARQNNGRFFVYNPYLIWDDKDDDDYGDLYTPTPPPLKDNGAAAVYLKKTLETMVPYVAFLKRIHEDVMESPTTMHEMFQKSSFYEVLFYYCCYKTSEDFLLTFMTAVNDKYLGFSVAALESMREKYTGKQYVAIIPRGLGKTRGIKLIISVSLMSFPGVEVLAMAHTRSLICSIKDDVEHTLRTCFPSYANGNYVVSKHDDSLILTFADGRSSRLKYASACRPATLRGNDPHIGLLDESLCVSEAAYSVINAMTQRKHCKIGFFSSPIATKKDALLNLVKNMGVKCRNINLYRLCFFCLDALHVQYSASQTGCYRRMFAPRYITYSADNKSFESVLTKTETSYENELGVIRPEDLNGTSDFLGAADDTDRAVFGRAFMDHLRNPTMHLQLSSLPLEENCVYWIYMDPAYHPSVQSAIAISCVRFVKDQVVLCYADRRLLTHGDLGRVSFIMEEMYTSCVTTLVARSGAKCYFFVAIERNSNPDAVRHYYQVWVDLRRRIGSTGSGTINANTCEFLCYADVYSGRNLSYGYNLGYRKKLIFSTIINFFNSKHVTHFRVATTAEHGVYSKDVCTLEHLVQEIKNFHYKDRKYTGKITPDSTDDLLTCIVMSTFLGMSFKMTAPSRIVNLKTERITHCTAPWIGVNCVCPLR